MLKLLILASVLALPTPVQAFEAPKKTNLQAFMQNMERENCIAYNTCATMARRHKVNERFALMEWTCRQANTNKHLSCQIVDAIRECDAGMIASCEVLGKY